MQTGSVALSISTDVGVLPHPVEQWAHTTLKRQVSELSEVSVVFWLINVSEDSSVFSLEQTEVKELTNSISSGHATPRVSI